ncbi:DUF3369 domain-containing protein [Aureimonas sp. AU12]|uniref:DUF3369 domain-containing protein n=1 Tax=Aureimonas sp. AU12 TaxID=1638161 RepID=UPI0009E67F7F|nr:DUF3369 domain-containing protein [Aureimonas sp. AU12]
MRDEWISFAPASVAPAPAPGVAGWKLLIVDDDQAVHDGTRFALQNFALNGRRLQLIGAHSAAEGFDQLARHPDTAVILLDVVMESDDAGLQLARRIRSELGNELVRIILRTGQPGQAPEHKIVVDYDINDYKAKTELTAERLFTTLTAALRSYDQLRRLDDTRRGLEHIVSASAGLFSEPSLEGLALGVLHQLGALLRRETAGIVAIRRVGEREPRVLARSGDFSPGDGAEPDLAPLFGRLDAAGAGVYPGRHTHLLLRTGDGSDILVVLEAGAALSPAEVSLLSVFRAKLAIAFDNARLHDALLTANEALEERVRRRTAELAASNERLEARETQLKRVNAFKNEILGTIAHDLKNPLAVILGRAEMLQALADRLGEGVGEDVAEPFRVEIRHVRGAAERLTRAVDRSMADAMADAMDIAVEARVVDLGPLVAEIVERNAGLAAAKSQNVRRRIAAPLWAFCDPDRIAEAIDNLVGNAVKYTPAGGTIEITAEVREGGIAIGVCDSGPGLRPDDLLRLFGRFQRLSAQPTGGESATGLGLSIARKIAELHGGRIEAAETGPLGGALFTLVLPPPPPSVFEPAASRGSPPTRIAPP